MRIASRHLILAGLWSLTAARAAWPAASLTVADTTAMPGEQAQVAVTLDLGPADAVATLQFNLTLVPQDTAPHLTSTVSFVGELSSPPSLVLNEGLETALVGWLLPFSPPLASQRTVGHLVVPVPAAAGAGAAYVIEVRNPSATSDGENDTPVAGVAGRLVVVGSPTTTASTSSSTTTTSTTRTSSTSTTSSTVTSSTASASTSSSSTSTTTTARTTSTGTVLCGPGGEDACADDDPCTDDSCGPDGTCRHVEQLATGPRGVSCHVEAVRVMVDRNAPCAGRCLRSIQARLHRLDALVESADTSGRARVCRKKLKAAAQGAQALQRSIVSLFNRGKLGSGSDAEALVLAATRLRDQALEFAASTFCTLTTRP